MHEPHRSLPSRRDVLALGVGAFVVCTLPRATRPPRALVRRTVPVMGTLAEIAVDHPDERHAQRAIDDAIAVLRHVDRTMSRFRDASDVGRANREALRQPTLVSAQTAAVLREALRWARGADGFFDPCLGALIRLWDVNRRRTPPPAERVAALAGLRLYASLELGGDAERPWVRFHDERVSLDLGGIAKGHGVDRAADALCRHDIRRALVNVGGDLVALSDGKPWRIGVRSGRGLDRTIRMHSGAVATSGDAEQGFRHRGRRYHHLLDPASGQPRSASRHSLTVRAPTCRAADAAATACFGLPAEQATALLAACAPDADIA